MRRIARTTAAIAGFAVLTLAASAASASPWTVPKDKLLLSLNYDFAFAENEFLPDGTYQSFPLNGRFTSSTLRLGGRYGFTDRLELATELTVKAVSFTADPIIPVFADDPEPGPFEAQEARALVRDFSNTIVGPADLFLTVRYNFLKGTFAFANETIIKLPTGYEPPSGTFTEELEVDDDLALGDGQTDIEDSLLFGLFIPQTKTFARADVGFRFRFGGPGHQGLASLKVGQFVGPKLVLFAGANGAYTVVDGDPIGSTFISTTGELEADDVLIGSPDQDGVNTIPVDLRIDKDFLKIEGGLLLLPKPGLEIQASYSQIVLGANIAAIQSVTLSTAIHFDDVTGDDEEE